MTNPKRLKVVTFKIDEAEYALAKRVAKKQDRTFGSYLRVLLADALKPHRPRWQPPPPPPKDPDHEALDELLDML